MHRVFEFLNEEEEPEDEHCQAAPEHVEGNVTFENVHFSYTPEKPLLQGLNAQVKSGQMVAIVGPTGVGKTTLINLLMRFYDVTGGAILIDGIDIRHMKRKDLRSKFGMVLQDTWLLKGTIRDNIAYGKDDATDADVILKHHAEFGAEVLAFHVADVNAVYEEDVYKRQDLPHTCINDTADYVEVLSTITPPVWGTLHFPG